MGFHISRSIRMYLPVSPAFTSPCWIFPVVPPVWNGMCGPATVSKPSRGAGVVCDPEFRCRNDVLMPL